MTGKRIRRPAKGKRKPERQSRRAWRLCAVLFLVGLMVGLFGPWLWWLDRQATLRFADRHLTEASRIYARPLELFDGLEITVPDLIVELEAAGLRAGSPEQPGRFSLNGALFVIHAPAFDFPDGRQAPWQARMEIANRRLRYDGGGVLRLPPAGIGRLMPLDERIRTPLTLAEFPPLMVAGVQAVEDRRFKHHFGVDPRGLLRAAWANLRHGRVVQGGSTITQQLVKNLFLTPERSLLRKFNEAIMALSLEARYSKAAILEAWLNEVHLGQVGERAIHGFGSAAEYYFGQPVSALDPGQIALLIGMVRGASWYHPLRNPERARQRRDQVLQMFEDTGLIDAAQRARYSAAGLALRPGLAPDAAQYGAFLDLVRRQLRSDYRDRDLRGRGLHVFTTLSPSAQRHAERALASGLAAAEKEPGSLQGAVVLVEPGSGEVRALLGDRQAGRQGFNRALDARRQVGSVIKPLVYLLALDQPRQFSLVTPVADEPLTLEIPGAEAWSPMNHDGVSHGSVPLMEALTGSYNQASVRIGLAVGVEALFGLMRQLGVEPGRSAHPAAFLGAVDLSPLQVAQLYQPLASEGYSAPLRAIREVMDSEGELIGRYPLRLKPIEAREALALVDFALRRVVTHGTGRALSAHLPDAELRGKTGTTNEQRDAWFVGYSSRWLGVVWTGRDDNRPAAVGGAGTALPIFARLFSALNEHTGRRASPEGIEWYWIDWPEAKLADEHCQTALAVPFIAGSQPNELSDCVSAPGRWPFSRQ